MSDLAPRPDTDEEWESLLREWRAQSNVQPRPFFYSRVRARLVGEAAEARPILPAWLRWPSYAAMVGIILLLSGDGAVVPSAATRPQPYLSGPPTALPAR
ncbi:hypothetical protein LJY25_16080 [Hymenobacter sp. BT175]|uniref:hypothetical protein n=1 Tax=Hymenobacter translucens TaxID=2886507 RepID=UPI001D0E7CE3|nr:hypothetical protein [Hymenobacter translucens]MCC2547968.1 hypothetical protein [Hymenobacter translucens]